MLLTMVEKGNSLLILSIKEIHKPLSKRFLVIKTIEPLPPSPEITRSESKSKFERFSRCKFNRNNAMKVHPTGGIENVKACDLLFCFDVSPFLLYQRTNTHHHACSELSNITFLPVHIRLSEIVPIRQPFSYHIALHQLDYQQKRRYCYIYLCPGI